MQAVLRFQSSKHRRHQTPSFPAVPKYHRGSVAQRAGGDQAPNMCVPCRAAMCPRALIGLLVRSEPQPLKLLSVPHGCRWHLQERVTSKSESVSPSVQTEGGGWPYKTAVTACFCRPAFLLPLGTCSRSTSCLDRQSLVLVPRDTHIHSSINQRHSF